MSVEFEMLGEVRASAAGEVIALGAARQRAVLAALVIDANHAITRSQLIDRVWGEHVPDTVTATIRSYLSRLRTALRCTSGFGVVTQSGSYVLRVATESVDLHRFTGLLARARDAADDRRAATLYEQAFGLWRGEPFTGLESRWFSTKRHQLLTVRHTARLDYYDIRLRRGEHAAVLANLMELAAMDPRDERVTAQLMLALYRSGRQAEALKHFERTRVTLSSELGADPGPALTRLHQQILCSDAALSTDEYGQRRAALRQAEQLYERQGRHGEAAIVRQLIATL